MSELIDASKIFYPSEESEPLEKPTDELEEEAPEETEESEEEVVEIEAEDEAEESEESEDDSEAEDESEDSTVKEAERMMHADYTKKTQALADERRAFEAERTALESEKSKVLDLSAELEVLVKEDEDINWEELKEDDPDRYIELKEKLDKRKAALEEIKKSQPKSAAPVLTQEEAQAESNDLFDSQGWKVDGKLQEDLYQSDIKMLGEYMSEAGYSEDEFKSITYSHHFKTLLDAARFNQQKKKGSALKKKVKKAPAATKPKANQTRLKKSAADVFYG